MGVGGIHFYSCRRSDLWSACVNTSGDGGSYADWSTTTEHLCHLATLSTERLTDGRGSARTELVERDADEEFVRRLAPSLRYVGQLSATHYLRRLLDRLGGSASPSRLLEGHLLTIQDADGPLSGNEILIRYPPPVLFWGRDVTELVTALAEASESYLNLEKVAYEAIRGGLLTPTDFDEKMLLNLSILTRIAETASASPESAFFFVDFP